MSREAREFYLAASGAQRRRFARCFQQIATDPRRHPNIRPLRGPLAGHYRYRVGDYRVVYAIDDERQTVNMVTIAHRSRVYE